MLRAPIGGVIAALEVREGMSVMPGATLFRIVDLSTVWVNAEVPESLSAAVRPGTPVEARVAAWPGETFRGRVAAILPEISAETRTVRARIELANPGARLSPGMFASLSFTPAQARATLLVPSESVIRTGTRTVVIVAGEKGLFRPVDVEVGGEAGGDTAIAEGARGGRPRRALGAVPDRLGGEPAIDAHAHAADGARGAPSRARPSLGTGRGRHGERRRPVPDHQARCDPERRHGRNDDGVQVAAGRAAARPEGRRRDPLRLRDHAATASSRQLRSSRSDVVRRRLSRKPIMERTNDRSALQRGQVEGKGPNPSPFPS